MKYDAIGVSLSSRVACANWLKKQFSLIDTCQIDARQWEWIHKDQQKTVARNPRERGWQLMTWVEAVEVKSRHWKKKMHTWGKGSQSYWWIGFGDWRKSRNQRGLLFTEINKTEAGAGRMTPNFLPCSLFWVFLSQFKFMSGNSPVRLPEVYFCNFFKDFFLQRGFSFLTGRLLQKGQVSLTQSGIKLTQVGFPSL